MLQAWRAVLIILGTALAQDTCSPPEVPPPGYANTSVSEQESLTQSTFIKSSVIARNRTTSIIPSVGSTASALLTSSPSRGPSISSSDATNSFAPSRRSTASALLSSTSSLRLSLSSQISASLSLPQSSASSSITGSSPSKSAQAGDASLAEPEDSCSEPVLANGDQTGNSTLGLISHPVSPKWLDGLGTTQIDPPWGNASVANSDATILRTIPTTNVTRRYSFTVSRGLISPDGVLRDVILVNGQFPGPAIEANWGDWIEVTVTNRITAPEEGTAMHWHGMLQRTTPWDDGVPGVGQCPIAPGQALTYRFQAEVHGTSWYHAHFSSQYTAGVAGPMIIYGPSSLDYDVDLGPVMLTDWNHIPYFSMVANTVGTNVSLVPPRSDNNLINGRGKFNCSAPSYSNHSDWLGSNLRSNTSWKCIENAPTSKFRFHTGKTYRLRLINHGADGIQKFSIDGHSMTVIATDFVPNVPYNTTVVTLAVGQRTDILVTASQASNSSWWMRTQTPGWPLCGGALNAEALAAIHYEDSDTCSAPTSRPATPLPLACENDSLDRTSPAYTITPRANVFVQDVVITIRINETQHAEWCINDETFRTNFNDPVMFRVAWGQTNFTDEPEWAVYNLDRNASVILNVTNRTPFAHPFHLHGHSFYVLDDGRGPWAGRIVNAAGPMRRDVQIVQGFGHVAVQIDLENPGVWPFHCHVAWHLSGGLNMQLLSQPLDIPAPPASMLQSWLMAFLAQGADGSVLEKDLKGVLQSERIND